MGLTGLITTVKFQLKKIETSYIKQKQIKATNLEEIIALFDQYKHYTYSVAWIDCLKKGKNFGRSILILGRACETGRAFWKHVKNDPLEASKEKTDHFSIQSAFLGIEYIYCKAFNFLYYDKNFKKEINNVVSYEPFFYPLDAFCKLEPGIWKKRICTISICIAIWKPNRDWLRY